MYVRHVAAAAAAFLGWALVLSGGPATTATAAASGESTTAAAATGRDPVRLVGAPVLYAHRGASAYAPENTLAAVDLAEDLGIDWVENDVQRTKDGELVVIHDDTLARTTDVETRYPDRKPWRVADFTAAEIAGLDAGSWFTPQFAGARVPTLRQYLDRVRFNQQKLLLEIKKPELYPGIEQDTLRVLEEAGWLGEQQVENRLVVQSFSVDCVRTVHSLRPDLITAFLGTPAAEDLALYAEFTDRINPWHTTITAEWVAAVHALRGVHGEPLEVDTWIVDDPAVARKVQAMGVDGIITNAPDVVREAVGGF
ncbi:glycerophosphodiester phosphodiesterase [Streptomyces venezuelae]|uniref:Glycerophosphodiester phosphodiesterase n=1 Tax=Streptomyces venezuelae TaxID=54571 RepID=A0A5P2D7F0_STRVZ|nr:glycerophosphodiester phosphodiesterase family protein [Streptomyces venezuelae]QES50683.1 glycerophosphodiester phosphodiesterase [Streptomyces venezuelae]